MYKKSASIFTIVFKSFKTFFDRLPQFLWFLGYPIFGQLIGVLLIFAPFWMASSPESVYLPMLALTLPLGLGIFCHSFWRYLLASASLVLISKQIVENGPVKDFKYYLDGFKKRSGEYIAFLLVTGFVIPLLLMLLIFIISAALVALGYLPVSISMQKVNLIVLSIGGLVGLIVLIFYSVPLQSFVLNPNLTPTESVLKGAKLTLRNYFPNLGLIILINIVTLTFGLLVSFIVSNLIFTGAFYEEHSAFRPIMKMLDLMTNYSICSVLLPFSTIAFTWWYLRMEKEHNSRVKLRQQ